MKGKVKEHPQPVRLTRKAIEEALERARPGAEELHHKLREVFCLPHPDFTLD